MTEWLNGSAGFLEILRYKRCILFLGASITQGRISKSFVRILKQKLGTSNYKFINQGVAGYESHNVMRRLDRAIKKMPDYVILLVGTNDILSSQNPRLATLSRKLKGIPHEPTLHHYSNNITRIVRRLKEETQSIIAIASLPVIGENLNSETNETVAKYNAELKTIAENEEVYYLPVYEKQKEFLIKEIEGKGKDHIHNTRMAFRSLVLHYLLCMNLDTISRRNGFLLLTDGIHQNSTGAGFIASEIEDFIKSS